MQSATEQDPRSGSGNDPSYLVLPAPVSGDWTVSFPPSLEMCVGRYARIPEFARHGSLLTIVRGGTGRPA